MNTERHVRPGLLITIVAGLSLAGSCGDDDSDGGGEAAAARSKLEKCGLISDGGELNFEDPEGEDEQCFANCFLNASCDDVEVIFCSEDIDETSVSEAYRACVLGCQDTVECELVESQGFEIDAAYRCNGFEECVDGSDEEGCPAEETFACADGDEEVPLDFKCDGEPDCEDESDEDGCPEGNTFACENGEKVPADYECDLEPDCEDGSDEHDACAQLMCD